MAYLVSLSVERMLESDDIGMIEFFHYLELSVFIALVLVNFLNRHDFAGFSHRGLVHHTEGAVAHHAVGVVGEAGLRGQRHLHLRVSCLCRLLSAEV